MDCDPGSYVFGPFRFDPSRRSLDMAGAPVTLSARGLDILQTLIEARDRVVGRDEIMARAWPGVVVEASNLTVQMSALRRALGDTGESPKWIVTVSGRGYRFIGSLADAADTVARHAAPLASPPSASEPLAFVPLASPLPASAPLAPPRPPTWRGIALLLPALTAIMAVGAWIAWTRAARPPTRPRLSVVVMPFRNLGGDPGHDSLADAITDDLTTDLSHIPGSLVIARPSADVYKGRIVPPDQIGRALNVRYMLEGSVRADGANLRTNVQLIDTANGTHLWAERFDASTAKLWDAETDIVHRITSALRVTLVADAAVRAERERPDNPDALDLFFRARSIIDRGSTLEGLTAAQNMLERALRKQPDFVEALATLGWLLVGKQQSFEYPTEAADDAEANRVITHALTLAPGDSAALAARARLLASDHRFEEARAAADAAVEADPGNLNALWARAFCAWQAGEPDKVVAALRAVLRIDPQGPTSGRVYQLLGLATLFSGEAPHAIPFLLRAEAGSAPPGDVDNPSQPEVTRISLIAAYALSGDTGEAARRVAAYRRIWPHRSVWRCRAFFNLAQERAPSFAAIETALATSGMPRFADEHADAAPAAAGPLAGGDFTATPLSIPGAARIDTVRAQVLLAGPRPPLVLDVGPGIAVPHGALLLSEQGDGDDTSLLDSPALLHRLQAAPGGVIVMGAGSAGVDSYNAALRLIARGLTVYWYRGGEEAWAAANLPADDRRAH